MYVRSGQGKCPRSSTGCERRRCIDPIFSGTALLQIFVIDRSHLPLYAGAGRCSTMVCFFRLASPGRGSRDDHHARQPRRCCDGLTRRETLKAGALAPGGGLQPARPAPGRGGPRRAGRPGKAKSVIVLYLLGGAATQDMFDLKPDAPAEVRGEFKPIATNVPGIQICEHLPLTAQWMHKAALVRSVNHKAGCHNSLPSYTGYEAMLADIITTARHLPAEHGLGLRVPASDEQRRLARLRLPAVLPRLGPGDPPPGPVRRLPRQALRPALHRVQPLRRQGRAAERPGYPQVLRGEPRLPDSTPGDGITLDRLNARRGLLEQLDDQVRRAEAQPALGTFDRTSSGPSSLLTSAKVKAAFDLDDEDPKLRDRYGRTLFGHSTLIARRLVEAGVRFVNVTWDCSGTGCKLDYDAWDTHTQELRHPQRVQPAVLRPDLLGAAGRPRRPRAARRDAGGGDERDGPHAEDQRQRRPRPLDVLLLGAASPARASAAARSTAPPTRRPPTSRTSPVSTGDICATIYHCLGIDPEMTVPDRTGRPDADRPRRPADPRDPGLRGAVSNYLRDSGQAGTVRWVRTRQSVAHAILGPRTTRWPLTSNPASRWDQA